VVPPWLQQASLVVPTRWAVDGLDVVTWRGLGADAAVVPVIALLASAVICVLIAVWRFRWED
jgi:ABC-2 type transport system permease protein